MDVDDGLEGLDESGLFLALGFFGSDAMRCQYFYLGKKIRVGDFFRGCSLTGLQMQFPPIQLIALIRLSDP